MAKAKRGHGCVLSVVGPDGVGKSTLIDALVGGVLSGREIMRIRNVGLLPRRTVPQVPVTEPHKDPPYSMPVSMAKVAYVYSDYLLGWFFRVRPWLRRGGWVILERGWWDMAVDPTRYRMKLPSFLMWRLGTMLPRPDLLLILEAPAEIVAERKKELPVEELRRQSQTWRRRLPASQPRTFLDASLPADRVLVDAEREVERLSDTTTPSGASQTVNLPRPGDPRWILPRASGPIASAGLRVYHPVTIKGVVGWNLGWACARLGLFRLLPRGAPPPEGVTRAVAPWVPSGGSIAVARANHPGRHVALILAVDGTVKAVAKIASDEAGMTTLEREAANLRRLGGYLRLPLVAPKLIAAQRGVVVLGAASWSPRPRPWHLPAEVAGALGASFNGSGDHCATHGDFAPWNLLKSGDEWVVLDWENAVGDGVAWHDLWHYIVQGHAFLKRPRATDIHRGLEGRGWIGDALSAYAEAARVTPSDASDALVSYLRTSAGDLDPSTHDGRLGLVARRKLLLSMGH